MSTPQDWPELVPQCFLLNSYLEEKQPVVIRSPVDQGPQKVRRRYTRAITGVVAGLAVTKIELDEFDQWFDVTLQGGSLSFYVTSPITGEQRETRFLQPPRLVPIDTDNFNLELIMEFI